MRPMNWLEKASPEEIAEALIATDPAKAARVASYLIQRAAPEIGLVLENVEQNMQRDPVGTIGSMLGAAFSQGSKRRR